jgi:hypothetical protein
VVEDMGNKSFEILSLKSNDFDKEEELSRVKLACPIERAVETEQSGFNLRNTYR